MEYIKSKFSGNSLFWGVFLLVFSILDLFFIFKILKKNIFKFGDALALLVLVCVFLFLINYLKHIKILILKGRELKYYSILRPFGKNIELNSTVRKIILTETGSIGSYRVIYLVNNRNEIFFKLMELHYKNFNNILDALKLETIKFSPSPAQYFKLLFFESVDLNSGSSGSNNSNKIINVVLKLFKTIVLIGLSLLLIHKVEKTLCQFIEDSKVFFLKMVEVPVQVFGWVEELEEIKGQFLDKVVKVFYLVVSVFTKLPEDADIDLIGTISEGNIEEYHASPVEESAQHQPHSLIGF
ncbi:hypothetical protein SAMN05421800_12625 [Chryseobacterium balustinum]|uniref:Uncharacterized protein n=2 Tax=Chryseobacterium balustinum TaxID=246 RepID=A0AAX2IP65_9FLAO|nr:hypothetical protein SAMN05421800_12625 [Chryseobacterium balustinum]SQA91821.1 Uncharacterised protein [Chryseobacterium balustinum]